MTKEEKCRFCKIISKEEKSYIVFEDSFSIAFLDKRPLFPGHTLLIPKKHLSTVDDLDRSLTVVIFNNLRLINKAVEVATDSQGTFVAINNKVSQSIPHLHIHVVPRRKKDGLRGFFWPRNPYRDQKHMEEVAFGIKNVVEKLRSDEKYQL